MLLKRDVKVPLRHRPEFISRVRRQRITDSGCGCFKDVDLYDSYAIKECIQGEWETSQVVAEILLQASGLLPNLYEPIIAWDLEDTPVCLQRRVDVLDPHGNDWLPSDIETLYRIAASGFKDTVIMRGSVLQATPPSMAFNVGRCRETGHVKVFDFSIQESIHLTRMHRGDGYIYATVRSNRADV